MEISFQKTTYKLLEAPYPQNCHNYHRGPVKRANPYFGEIYSHYDCVKSCVIKKVIKKCKCWPPEIPFISDKFDNTTKNLLLCNWMKMAKGRLNETIDKDSEDFVQQQHRLQRSASQIFAECMNSYVVYCEDKCPASCIYSSYAISYERTLWPSEEKFNKSETSRNLRRCCSIVSTAYQGDFKRLILFSPKYDFFSTFSSLIGIFSLWIGLTAVSILPFSKSLIQQIFNKLI